MEDRLKYSNNIRISFDFDGTLTRPSVQEYAKKLISEGFDVYIVTRRESNEVIGCKTWDDDLFEVADYIGIKDKRNKIIFFNFDSKVKSLKDSFIDIHIDDSMDECREIDDSHKVFDVRPLVGVYPICVFGSSDWIQQVENKISVHIEKCIREQEEFYRGWRKGLLKRLDDINTKRQKEKEIDDKIDFWHENDCGGITLHEYLGLSREDYHEFVRKGALDKIKL